MICYYLIYYCCSMFFPKFCAYSMDLLFSMTLLVWKELKVRVLLLKYTFLGEYDIFPAIVTVYLTETEEKELLTVLEAHKEAIYRLDHGQHQGNKFIYSPV